MKRLLTLLALGILTASASADDATAPAAGIPDIAPFLVPSLEDRFAAEATRADAIAAKADAEATKAKRIAAEARLKGYKDKLAEITKTGDFDKAQQVKARITQLENEPEGESHKPSKRPRPKDTVRFDGHAYALIKEPATWHVAKQRCAEMGGHLVVIDSEKELEFIDKMCNTTIAWMGASNEESDTEWKWVTGSRLIGNGWIIDDYKTDATKASALTHWSNHRFEDYPLSGRVAYVCEWDK